MILNVFGAAIVLLTLWCALAVARGATGGMRYRAFACSEPPRGEPGRLAS